MGDLNALTNIDFFTVFLSVMAILLGVKFVVTTIEWFMNKFGIETKSMREKRENKELLKTTAELATATAENLSKLQNRHTKDEEEFRNNLNNYIEESRRDRKALHDEMNRYSENRINDRKQSLEIQKELTTDQSSLSNSVRDISEKLDSMKQSIDERFSANEEKENTRVQSEIKERIAQSYREYNRTKKISKMELEALEDSIKTYEMHGGKNSFVHSVVQKEMYTWEIE